MTEAEQADVDEFLESDEGSYEDGPEEEDEDADEDRFGLQAESTNQQE